jgi:hypothetical protein
MSEDWRPPPDWHLHIDDLLEGVMDGNMKMSRAAKEELVTNGPDDLPPTFGWYLKDGSCIGVPIAQIAEVTGQEPPDILAGLAGAIRQREGPPILAILGYEAWMRLEGAPPDDRPPEAVVLIVATAKRSLHAILPFSYGDGGVVWAEPTVVAIPTSDLAGLGPMPAALYVAFMPVEAN